MNLSPTIQERIFQAADGLYAESEQQTFPTVDAVRKSAKVNMNDASTGMKAWRRAQTAQVAPVTVQVPSSLQQSSAGALASLWAEAIMLTNETLRAAEAGWNSERVEAEALREQVASAYETQAMEFESLRASMSDLHSQIEHAQAAKDSLQKQVDHALSAKAVAEAAIQQSEARATEIQRRADDLRKELDYAHTATSSATLEMATLRHAQEAAIANLRMELAESKSDSEAQLTAAQSDLANAREEIARLRGNLEGLQQKAPANKAKSRLRNNAAEPSTGLFPDEGMEH
jgi:colicin import membrane protein